jgi:hypothetical protein
MLKKIMHAPQDEFTLGRMEAYLKAIHNNSRVNESRTRMIYKGELVFVADIIVILVSIMLQLLAVLQGQIIQSTIGGG